MRGHRERRRRGLRCLTIELSDMEIAALIRMGLLSVERVTILAPSLMRFINILTHFGFDLVKRKCSAQTIRDLFERC